MHLDVETTARIFEFFNFAIVALAIVIPLARIMPKVLRKRSETIKHDLEAARKTDRGCQLAAERGGGKAVEPGSGDCAIRARWKQIAKHDEARIKATH